MLLSQMLFNWKTFGRRAKLVDIWDSDVLVEDICSTFDLVMFNAILGFCNCVEMSEERKRLRFVTREYYSKI